MQKFRCAKCGHRIAIQPRHLGMLVTCPECGNLTHPLAEKIIERGPAPAPVARSPHLEPSRSCENCGRSIGRLEKPERWDECIVCTACYRALSDSSKPPVLVQDRRGALIHPEATSNDLTVLKRVRRQAVSRSQRPMLTSLPRLSFRLPQGPLRIILWLIVVALAAWFVLNVVRFISVLANVAIVGFLLLATLWVLYQSGMRDASHPVKNDPRESDSAD